MLHPRRLASLLVLLSACGGSGPPRVETSCTEATPEGEEAAGRSATLADLGASGPLARLSWLAGEWESWDEESGRCTTEQWMTPAGTSMLGASRTVASGRTVAWERLAIEARDDGIVYVAAPSGQAVTEFRLVESGVDTFGADFAVFENPEHDFPVRIRYALGGETLTARIEGREPGHAAEWTFRGPLRSPCPRPPSDVPPSD